MSPRRTHYSSSVLLTLKHYSWIGPRWELGRALAFGLSMSDFNSESRFGILMKNYTRHFRWIFEKSRIEFADFFVSALWCNWNFFRFRRFASTMVALPSFLGESVPDGGKWGRFGKPRTTRFTRDHREHVERSLTCFSKPLTATACMAGGNNYSRAKRQNDIVIL